MPVARQTLAMDDKRQGFSAFIEVGIADAFPLA
jgi:hypothetical protein